MKTTLIQQLVWQAGLAQIALSLGSLLVPQVLGWKIELAKTRPLIKQMFWTYAAYILCINLAFGLISLLDSRELTNGTPLAASVTGFIAVYWISRVLIQFFYFDRKDFPTGKWHLAGEFVLVSVFVLLSIVYSLACYHNLTA